MNRSILIVCVLFSASCQASEHVLQLNDPPKSAVLVSVPVNSSVVLRCVKAPGLPDVQWLHNGNDLNPDFFQMNDEKSSITILRYSTKDHDGVYECYAGSASTSIRLLGEEEVILPTGFRFCHKSENAACDHARACMADGMGKTSCVCYPGWSGETCNLPREVQKANVINVPVCPYWPPVITLMVFILCVFLMLICLYNFKNRAPSKTFRYRGSRKLQNFSTVMVNHPLRKERV
ncbi:hypothetical protein Q1695_001509 [Nippostrongylus brasiliensis]|nr:hypothetical protein Q1695_001509 [Nippostrongylus brasiliensis]